MAGIPRNCKTIRVVSSLSELFNAKMEGEISCILLPRALKGDFDGLARKILKTLGENDLFGHSRATLLRNRRRMDLTGEQEVALDQICEDMKFFKRHLSEDPCGVRVLPAGYMPDDTVNSFHQDSGPGDRVLAAYNVAGTYMLLPEDVAGCEMNRAGSRVFIPRKGARIIELPLGSIWRQATTDSGTAALIHRAPDLEPMSAPRLLLTA
jgi:hypothetical protein